MPLADTSFLIDVLRNHPAAVALLDEIEREGEPLRVPSIVIHELLRGVAHSNLPDRETRIIEEVLLSRPIVAHGAQAARVGGLLEGTMRAKGRRMEPEDCMIAAMAMVEGDELVTADERDFARVSGLQLRTYR